MKRSKYEQTAVLTDLHSTLSGLMGGVKGFNNAIYDGLTKRDIGMMYAVTVLSDNIPFIPTSNDQSTSKESLMDRRLSGKKYHYKKDGSIVIDQKKRYQGEFQKQARIIFYRLLHQLDPTLGARGDRSYLLYRYNQEASCIDNTETLPGTIEHEVKRLAMQDRFEEIYSALLTGSASYHHEGNPRRLSQEYNRILKKMEKAE